MIEGACHCGKVVWSFDAVPEGATSCNCTICRRYGAIWIFNYEDRAIKTSGETVAYACGPMLDFHFCPTCGCVTWWLAKRLEADGRRRQAVNLRLAKDPDAVMDIAFYHFDGLKSFEDVPRPGNCVADMWF